MIWEWTLSSRAGPTRDGDRQSKLGKSGPKEAAIHRRGLERLGRGGHVIHRGMKWQVVVAVCGRKRVHGA